jgi:hypothetical protein
LLIQIEATHKPVVAVQSIPSISTPLVAATPIQPQIVAGPPKLSPGQSQDVDFQLQLLVDVAGRELSLSSSNVRANIFMPANGNELQIPSGLAYHMWEDNGPYLTKDSGATGWSFRHDVRLVTFLHDKRLNSRREAFNCDASGPKEVEHSTTDSEYQSIFDLPNRPDGRPYVENKNLVWIFSTPIHQNNTVVGVLNLDYEKKKGDHGDGLTSEKMICGRILQPILAAANSISKILPQATDPSVDK